LLFRSGLPHSGQLIILKLSANEEEMIPIKLLLNPDKDTNSISEAVPGDVTGAGELVDGKCDMRDIGTASSNFGKYV
jgi:hypothetical protein